MTVQQALEQIDDHLRHGRLVPAETLCRQILQADPRHAKALHMLAFVALRTNHPNDAVELFRQSVASNPTDAFACSDFGQTLNAVGRFDEAVGAFRAAIAMAPNMPAARMGLGIALYELGHGGEAQAEFERAAALDPTNPQMHTNLARALNLAHRPAEAAAAARRAVELSPAFVDAYIQLGNALTACGRVDDAIAALREVLRLKPGWTMAYSNLLYALYFSPTATAASILDEHRRWASLHAAQFAASVLAHPRDRSPDRRLRIGYFCADFRRHVASFFTIPLLENHDHAGFEIFCYSNSRTWDAITERLQKSADTWRDVAPLTDERIAELIASDSIDILVDLTMHMDNGRPLLFARKPAPIQVAWLAYPGTTGLSTVDYRLSDPYLDPPSENGAHYTERTLRLPNTFWCYDPLTTEPAVNALPADSSGHVMFGCFNNFSKTNDLTFQMWRPILQAIPDSKLILLAPPGSHRREIISKLGVDESRVEFVDRLPRPEYLKLYHRVDVCLDTFPYNSHTTGLDAMWMGVPTVSRRGDMAVSRAGWSQSSNIGATELVADDADGFVKIAVELANDRARLRELRSTLRQRMKQSPLMEGPRFARDVETIYRQIWRTWCAS